MVRILRLITSSNPDHGGPIETTHRFGQIWAGKGHRQDIATMESADAAFLPDYPGTIYRLGEAPGRGPRSRYRFAPKAVPWLKENLPRYDAVIVSGLWRYTARAARRALVGGPVPYFVYPHGMLDPYFSQTNPAKHWIKQVSWLFAEGPLLNNATRVLFTSDEEAERARGVFRPYTLHPAVIGYGTADVPPADPAQAAAFREAVPALGDRRFLLFLSRIHAKKGCDLLVQAFAEAASRMTGVDLVIAGPDQSGLVASLKALADRGGVGNHVHFPGMLQGAAKFGAFRSCEAFILPSHQENFGVVVAEALACSRPVLISDKVNIWREIVADGSGLVEPDTLDGTRNLIARFCALSPDEREEMSCRARHSFIERFDAERAADALIALIERETGTAKQGD
jgi:glycosyltransferase involved in cell wall biosynthesis